MSHRHPGHISVVVGMIAVFFPLLVGLASHPTPQKLPRTIIGFYDPKASDNVSVTPIHLHAEVILNHLGLEVIHRPITGSLPSDSEMEEVLGVMTWFEANDTVPNPDAFCAWLTEQMKRGKKWVMFGNPGFFWKPKEDILSPTCQTTMQTLGATFEGDLTANPYRMTIAYKNPLMMDFERKRTLLDPIIYAKFKPVSPQVTPHFSLTLGKDPESISPLVFTSPNGGMAFSHTMNYTHESQENSVWYLNPVLFFETALGVSGLPRPDTNTIHGRRIYYSHIDGDGIVNVSLIDKQRRFAGEIIYDEILKNYPTLPVTTSFITGYFTMEKYQSDRVKKMYKNILSLPNTEPASHTFAHPAVWQSGKLDIPIEGYRFSGEREIVGSIADMKNLLQDLKIDKKTELLLWSGDCKPSEQDVRLTYANNLLNMNGGDTVSDRRIPGYSAVSPLSLLQGESRQIYASSSNEMRYILATKPDKIGGTPYVEFNLLGLFRRVIETYTNTEHPILIKPINLYYHFFIGERTVGLQALKSVYQHILAQKIFPIFASDYVKIVQDFFDIQMERLAPNTFHIRNNGYVRTIRFDHESRFPDFEKSLGIIGFKHFQNNLYVFLNEEKEHTISLTSQNPTKPYFQEASFWISDFKGNNQKLAFQKKGWHTSESRMGGLLPSRSYRVSTPGQKRIFKTSTEGVLALSFPTSEGNAGHIPVEVEVLPSENAHASL